jgi:hypothetical protein
VVRSRNEGGQRHGLDEAADERLQLLQRAVELDDLERPLDWD